MAKKNKYYVVFEGKKIGIFDNWKECEEQVKGFKGAKYKGYSSLSEAKAAFNGTEGKSFPEIEKGTICVDGACSGNPGVGEYQCVETDTGELIFHESGFEDTTNNIMEYIALVQAIKYLTENKMDRKIYSDSVTAIAWVRDKKSNSNLRPTRRNYDSKKMLDAADEWLQNNEHSIEILKWDTKKWGEIPADFGRKG